MRLVRPRQAERLQADPLAALLAAQLDVEPPPGTDYHKPAWGPWSVCSHANVARHQEPTWYEIDLDRLAGVNSAWEWMTHLDGKTWVEAETLGALFRVVNDILGGDEWLNRTSTAEGRIGAVKRYERRAELTRLPCPLNEGGAE